MKSSGTKMARRADDGAPVRVAVPESRGLFDPPPAAAGASPSAAAPTPAPAAAAPAPPRAAAPPPAPAAAAPAPPPPDPLTHEERFALFHKANPHVYTELVRRTRSIADRGFKRLGIRMIWEAMRYDRAVETNDPTGLLKLNDHYPAFYARLIMKSEPGLEAIFETRGSL